MVTTVDTGFADWLKAGALYVTAVPANAASWAGTGKGVNSEIVSPYATRADAVTAAAAQAAFLAGPLVRDNAIVVGARKDLIGKCVTLTGDRLGYTAGGVNVYVLGATEQENGTTILNVLRKL